MKLILEQYGKLRSFCGSRLEWLLLSGVVCGVWCAANPWFALVAGLVGILLCGRRSAAFLAALLIGIGSTLWHQEWGRGHYGAWLDGRDRGGEVELRMNDTALSRLEQLPPPTLVGAELIRIRLAGEEAFRETSGAVLVRLPRSFAQRPLYGDVWRMTGVFELAAPAPGYRLAEDGRSLAGRMELRRNFSDYLDARQVAAVFFPEESELLRQEPGAVGGLLRVRDVLAGAVMRNMDDLRWQRASSALFFGCRNGLNADSKTDYIRSGTIHVFVVSGFHVGVIAMLLLWILKPLPFRWRYGLLPVGTLLFVLMTGANVPALRAWVMITVWGMLRMMLFRISAIGVLGFLAAGLIAWNPAILRDVGFLYSFVITGALLVFADRGSLLRPPTGDVAELMPGTPVAEGRRRRLARRRGILLGLAGCGVAFLAGCAITLGFQGVWLPGSVLANILLLPIAGVMFQLAGLKLLLGWCWSGVDRLFAWLLERCFGLVDWMTGGVATLFDSTAVRMPEVWEFGCFYLALLLLLLPGRRCAVRRWIGAGGVAVLICWWHFAPLSNDAPAVLVVRGGDMELPCVAIADPVSGLGTVVNVPDWDAAAFVADFFRRRGIQRIDRVVFSESRSGAVKGIRSLLREMPVNVIQLPEERSRGDHFFRNFLSETMAREPELVFTASRCGFLQIMTEKTEKRVEYFNPGSTFKVNIAWSEEPERFWSIEANGRSIRLPWEKSSVMEIAEYEF